MSSLVIQEATERAAELRSALASRADALIYLERIRSELGIASADPKSDPERSTDAIVIHRPAARYFSV